MKHAGVRFGFAFFDEWRRRGIGKKLLRKLFPGRRKRNARRDERGARPADGAIEDFLHTEEDITMSPLILALLGGFARTVVPAATAYLAGLGITLPGGTSDILLVALAVVAWGGMQLWSILRKRFTIPETIGSLLRVLLPTLTAFSAGQGIMVDAGSTQSVLLSAVVALAMVGWSAWRKYDRTKTGGTP